MESVKSATMCKYWAVGRCNKGQQCPYAHSWQASSNTSPPKPKRKRTVTWYAPSPDWIKINTDGAVRGSTGDSSCAAVFRNSERDVVGAFSWFLGNDNISALEAEMQGVIRAMNVAAVSELRKVWVETDSSQIVNLIKDRSTDVPSYMRDRWCNMLNQIDQLEDFLVSHIYREGNTVADTLANYAIESRAKTVWNQAPDFIVRFVLLDASCYAYSRS